MNLFSNGVFGLSTKLSSVQVFFFDFLDSILILIIINVMVQQQTRMNEPPNEQLATIIRSVMNFSENELMGLSVVDNPLLFIEQPDSGNSSVMLDIVILLDNVTFFILSKGQNFEMFFEFNTVIKNHTVPLVQLSTRTVTLYM
jgi:hypothetical protein